MRGCSYAFDPRASRNGKRNRFHRFRFENLAKQKNHFRHFRCSPVPSQFCCLYMERGSSAVKGELRLNLPFFIHHKNRFTMYEVIIDGIVYRGSEEYILQVIKEDRENRG